MRIMTGSQLRDMIKDANPFQLAPLLESGTLDFGTLRYTARALVLAGYTSPEFDMMADALSATPGQESVYQTYIHNGIVYGPDAEANRMVQAAYNAHLNPQARPSSDVIVMLGQAGSELLTMIQTNIDSHVELVGSVGNDGEYDTMIASLVQIQYLLSIKWYTAEEADTEYVKAIEALRANLMKALPDYADIFSTTIENGCFVGDASELIGDVLNAVTLYRSNEFLDMLTNMASFSEEE